MQEQDLQDKIYELIPLYKRLQQARALVEELEGEVKKVQQEIQQLTRENPERKKFFGGTVRTQKRRRLKIVDPIEFLRWAEDHPRDTMVLKDEHRASAYEGLPKEWFELDQKLAERLALEEGNAPGTEIEEYITEVSLRIVEKLFAEADIHYDAAQTDS